MFAAFSASEDRAGRVVGEVAATRFSASTRDLASSLWIHTAKATKAKTIPILRLCSKAALGENHTERLKSEPSVSTSFQHGGFSMDDSVGAALFHRRSDR